jgi:hypothetical protein
LVRLSVALTPGRRACLQDRPLLIQVRWLLHSRPSLLVSPSQRVTDNLTRATSLTTDPFRASPCSRPPTSHSPPRLISTTMSSSPSPSTSSSSNIPPHLSAATHPSSQLPDSFFEDDPLRLDPAVNGTESAYWNNAKRKLKQNPFFVVGKQTTFPACWTV